MTLAVMGLSLIFGLPTTSNAAFQSGDPNQPNVLVGRDDDNVDNPEIQPNPDDPNQSLNNTDIIFGGWYDDVLIGLLGNDQLYGLRGNDILIGGTEQGETPNSDIMFGGGGHDISIWAPGDGSEFFHGGYGTDAQVFGLIDRDSDNVPTLDNHMRPSVEVTQSPGFCTLERVEDPDLGFDFLVRFFVRASGNLAVTVRLKDVEQVFCTSEAGGAITYANLKDPQPSFNEVSLYEVRQINNKVGMIIR